MLLVAAITVVAFVDVILIVAVVIAISATVVSKSRRIILSSGNTGSDVPTITASSQCTK